MPAEGDFIRVIVLGSLPGATNPIVNTWDYKIEQQPLPAGLNLLGPAIRDAFIARYYQPLQGVISFQYKMTGLSIRTYGKGFDGYDDAGELWAGGAGGNVCPPFVAYNVMRIRSDFSMRQGRKSFAGVPTSAIWSDGQPAQTVRDTFNTVFNGWETTTFTVEAADNDLVLTDRLVRNADLRVVPTMTSFVAGYQLKGFGSQNTRKG